MALDQHIHRHLSVQFSTKFIKGVSHEDVLNELKKQVDQNDIKAIQITERDCVITVANITAKNQLLVEGIDLNNQFFRMMDIEKQVTNVTIKDAPVELNDLTICTYMQQYGEVVQGSIKRGLIKGTEIENGTRYVQLINCVPIIPNNTKFGRFEVRLFADNNRTECKYCGKTGHPSYRCNQKTMYKSSKSCYRCNSKDHMIKDCPHDTFVCFKCGQEGHKQRDCAEVANTDDIDTQRQMYGEYIHDILEGRQTDSNTNEETTHDDNSANLTNEVSNKENKLNPIPENSEQYKCLILGASNCNRLKFTDPNIINVSVSGSTAEGIDSLLDLAEANVDPECVNKVIFSLGTNDVTKNKTDHNVVCVNIANAINKTKCKFPNAEIGVCNILPRKGKSPNICRMNVTGLSVNTFIESLCKKDPKLSMIDLWTDFSPNGNTTRSLYDPTDQGGVHVSTEGASLICATMTDFFFSSACGNYQTPSKRKRSNTSTPGSAEKQQQKIHKTY